MRLLLGAEMLAVDPTLDAALRQEFRPKAVMPSRD
jgi:hypothetical protein